MTDDVARVETAGLGNERLEFGGLENGRLEFGRLEKMLNHMNIGCDTYIRYDLFSCNNYDNLYALVD